MPLMFRTTVLIQQTQHKHSCPPVGFEPTIPVSERPQTHALDRTTTGIGFRSPDRPARSVIAIPTTLLLLLLLFISRPTNAVWEK
jgi:hypothetical protein